MLKYRLVFGPIMIALLIGVFYLDNRLDRVELSGFWQQLFLGRTTLPAGLVMLAVLLTVIILASRELCRIFHAENIPASPFMVGLSGCIGCTLVYIIPYTTDSQQTIAIYASFMVGIFVLSLVRHSWGGRTQGAVTVAAVTMFALIYIGTLPGFYLAIRRWHSAWIIVAVILITKSCDIGAYFTGRAIGRNKLIPWLSPGKTWEGFVGGVALSAIVAVGLTMLANHYDYFGRWTRMDGERIYQRFDIPLWYAAMSGIVLGAIGVLGDLAASLFKRDAGIKDSGKTIPGFGGVIDVVDSPILVAPFAYWLVIFAASVATPVVEVQ
jgi:phosphatidate cytidylyltransferase